MLAKMPHPAELDVLLDYLVLSARELIAKHGEVYPLAAVIDRSVGVAAFAIDDEDDQPDPSDLATALADGLREGALRGAFVATGVCVDVEIHDDQVSTSALSVQLDHIDGVSFVVLIPYEIVGRLVKLGDAQVKEGAHAIFPPT